MRKGSGKKIVKVADLGRDQTVDTDAVVSMSLRLDHPLYERLRKLSFDKRKPMRDFIIRGVEQVLKGREILRG